jgi:hypothetical protein
VEPDLRRLEVITWPDGVEHWVALGTGDEPVTSYGARNVDDIYDVVDAMSATDTRP